MKIVLATGSPYRIKAFKMLGINFEPETSNADEKYDGRPDEPEQLVKTLAKLKAETIAKNHQDGIIIGFDSVGFFEGQILEKPKSRDEAFERLKKLSGKKFQFYTGIHFINKTKDETTTDSSITNIWMRELSEKEINKYLDSDDRITTFALGFDPEAHYSATFAEKVEGSYNNLLHGIPLEVMVKHLKKMEAIK